MSDLATLAIKVDSTGVTAASKHLDELTGKAQKVEGATKKVETATQSVSSAFDKLKGVVKAVAASYAAMKLVDYIKDATLMAARYETLGVVMKVVGNNAGYSATQMEAFAKGLEKTGISMVEARNTLIRMTQAQLDLTKSSELARVAQDAAVIGNVNSSEAFQRLVYGIQSAQTEVLRTIGINVNFEKSYQDVAKATGRTVASFTEAEKSQIRMNAVMESGIMIAGAYEASMQTAGKQMNSLQRHIDNMKTSLGLAFTPALAEIIETITGAVADLNGELSGASKEAIKDWGNEFRLTILDIEIRFKSLSIIIGKMRQTLYGVNLLLSGPGRALGSESATRNFEYAADQIIKLQEEEKALDVLIKKKRDLEYAMTPEGKEEARKAALEAEAKLLKLRKDATDQAGGGTGIIGDDKADALKKLREEAEKINETLGNDIKMSGLDELEKKLFEIQIKYEKLAKNPLVDKGLLSTARSNEESSARWEARSQELKKEAELTQEITKAEEELIKTIQDGYDATMAGIQKQYDADGQLLRDKLELYKDLTGFEDEYRQVQLDWIERIKNEEIKATGDVAAAEKKAAKERAQIEYNLFKTKTDYIASGFGQLQSAFTAIAATYDEGSEAAKRWQEAAKAMEIAQKAVAVVQAVAAIATQGLGDPYTAFARIAAMAATMGALLASIGTSIDGSGAAATAVAPAMGNSTVLGAAYGAASESIPNSMKLLEETYDMQELKLTKIHNELRNLNSNITGLVSSILRTTNIGRMSYGSWVADKGMGASAESAFLNLDLVGGLHKYVGDALGISVRGKGLEFWASPLTYLVNHLLGSIVQTITDGIFGGKVTYTIGSVGIALGDIVIGEILNGVRVSARKYTFYKKTTEGGWFGKDKNEYGMLYDALDESVIDMFTKVFNNLGDTLVYLAESLGTDVSDVYEYVFKTTHINLLGKTGEEMAQALTEYFSKIGDEAARDLFGEIITQYQQLNEGLLETAIRLVRDKEIIKTVLEMTGQSFSGTIPEMIRFSETLIQISGGLEKLTDAMQTYYNAFFSDAEKQMMLEKQLMAALAPYGLDLPGTRAGYRALVESLNLTTEAGQAAYVALMQMSQSADEYYKYLEQAKGNIKPENYATELEYKRAMAGFSDGGLSYGPESGYEAKLHGTELIISQKKGVPAKVQGMNTGELVTEIRALRAEVGQGNFYSKANTDKIVKLLDRWEAIGPQPART